VREVMGIVQQSITGSFMKYVLVSNAFFIASGLAIASLHSPAAIAETGSALAPAFVTIQEVVPTDEEIYLDTVLADTANPTTKPAATEPTVPGSVQPANQPAAQPANQPGNRPANQPPPRRPVPQDDDSSTDDMSDNEKPTVKDMVIIGEKVIKLIEKGKVSVSVVRQTLSVVPQGVTLWTDLENWSPVPQQKVFRVDIRNAFCSVVANARLKVSFLYGGSHEGKGKFLSNVTMIPTSIYAGYWGTGFDLYTEFRDPVNIGTKANPVAALGFDVRYRFYSIFGTVEGAYDAFVNGKGVLQLDTTAENNNNYGCK
jgi:hypothetical protein